MKILGIETSCDETAAAIVEDGRRPLSSVVASQAALHARYGGVVPEVASRQHLEAMLPVVQATLQEAGCAWGDLDAVAVTAGPGLVGALLVDEAVRYARAAGFEEIGATNWLSADPPDKDLTVITVRCRKPMDAVR